MFFTSSQWSVCQAKHSRKFKRRDEKRARAFRACSELNWHALFARALSWTRRRGGWWHRKKRTLTDLEKNRARIISFSIV